MNPLRAVGRLRCWNPDNPANSVYLGTCFAYRWQNRFVTAAHTIEGLAATQIAVETSGGLLQTAVAVQRHPTADAAVVDCGFLQIQGVETEPFWLTVENWTLGEDIMAYGFPIDVLGKDAAEPTPRLFKGYFQRFMPNYVAYSGYKYLAGEINFACPSGLSGGPVFRPAAHQVALGIATENLSSTTSLQAYEQELVTGLRGGDRIVKDVQYREIISYGTVLMLSGISDWLDQWCPPRDPGTSPASLAQWMPDSDN